MTVGVAIKPLLHPFEYIKTELLERSIEIQKHLKAHLINLFYHTARMLLIQPHPPHAHLYSAPPLPSRINTIFLLEDAHLNLPGRCLE